MTCLFYFYVCTHFQGSSQQKIFTGHYVPEGGDPPISKCSGVSSEKTVVYMHEGSCTHGFSEG